jgi:hypothetical protein
MTMKKIFTLFFIFASTQFFGQGRMYFSGNPYIVLDPAAPLANIYFVIANNNANAITNPSQGKIISESELHKIRWGIGNSIGNYIVPFWTSPTGGDVAVGLNIDSAGTGTSNYVDFSTYGGKGSGPWVSFTNRPSDVTHTNNVYTLAENSPSIIDRFWIVEPNNYTIKPAIDLNISYIDAEYTAAGNVGILEADLTAQRFNSGTAQWFDMFPTGAVNTALNEIDIANISRANFFRSWTLTSYLNPLPVEILSFKSECFESDIMLEWNTATEINNDFFTLEKSKDGINWNTINVINGQENSTTLNTYQFKDPTSNDGLNYYKLSQTDLNGFVTVIGQTTSNCSSDNFRANAYVDIENNNIHVSVSTENSGNYLLNLYDSKGNLISNNNIELREGNNNFRIPAINLTAGIYLLNINGDIDKYSQKLFIRK